MKEYKSSSYGDLVAEKYDTWYSGLDPKSIECLYSLVSGPKVLELGIGTGRVALPLAAKGLIIQGIDSSRAMIDKLREKKGGEKIPVKIGSFSKFEFKEKFDLAYLVFNTIFALTTQQEQVSCFKSVSQVLKKRGKFVIEAFVPDLKRFDKGQTVKATDVSMEEVKLESSIHDLASQTVFSQIIQMGEKGIKLFPIKIRYSWPSELDLMAQIAGLKLISRWSDWEKHGFTSDSTRHISVYGKRPD